MTRVAIYARYSSDLQSEVSIDDQIRICRERATREGWSVAACYHDSAISGSSTIRRGGIQTLLEHARADRFDMVLAEALDRISRDQEDTPAIYKRLKFLGVKIFTLSEGAITELHVGFKGTMNAIQLLDLADKTRRGLRGRVEEGKSGGGISYGYDVVRQLDARGEPIRGDREINEQQAEIVRRIFREFAAGLSPIRIAERLNRDGIPGPRGNPWGDTTIHGNQKRGTGILNNELYVGFSVWNRLRYVKDPDTGKRVSRLNPEAEWIVKDVPELRIVDDELWQAVKARQAEVSAKYANVIAGVQAYHENTRLREAHRPKSLLSGLIFCGCCGGRYSLRGGDRFGCSAHVGKRTCDNGRTIRREELEDRVLAGLRDKLMTPEVAEEAMRAYAEETNRLNRERRSSGDAWKAELVKIEKQIRGIIEAIKAGMFHESMKGEMTVLEARKGELTALLRDVPDAAPLLLPRASAIYAQKVERLAETLNHPEERIEAADALRGLIEKIVLTPGPKRGQVDAMLYGELATILDWIERQAVGGSSKTTKPAVGSAGLSVSMVAGARNHLKLRSLPPHRHTPKRWAAEGPIGLFHTAA